MIVTTNNQTPNNTDELVQSDRPILWVSKDDLADAQATLSTHFQVLTPENPIQSSLYQIIALQSEREIRRLIPQIQAQDPEAEVKVYQLETSIACFLAFQGQPFAGLMMGSISPEQWLKSRADEPLNLEDALVIAGDILATKKSQTQANIELDSLRQRCNMTPYDWNRYIKDLEAEIHAAVDAKNKIDRTEKKRLELKMIAQERDPYRFTDALIEFCRRTGWTRRDAEQQIRLLKTSTIIPKAKRLKGKDFLSLETESISWVFPGIIPSRGVFVVGGHAGAGKTTLAYDAVGSLLLGEEFLGEKPVKTGKVLVVTGDELPCFTQDKLIDRGIPLDNEDWEIILNWDVSQWDELEEAIADIRPALVVIDSFSSIHRDPNFDENSSQAKSTIYDLEALTNAYNCGCVLIHHLSKSKENQGVAKLRGSSAIAAAASVVCIMDQTSDGARKLSFPKVRGAQTEPFSVTLDGSTGRYKVLSGGDNCETKSLSERILAFLQENPYNRFEQDEISEALSIPPTRKDSVYQSLGRLFKRGLITKRPSQLGGKRKVYGVSNPSQLAHTEGLRTVTNSSGDTHPPLPDKVSVQIAETVITQILEVTDTLTDTLTDSELTHQSDVKVENTSTVEPETVSVKLTDKEGEGCVCVESVETVTQPTKSETWVKAIHPKSKEWTTALYLGRHKNGHEIRFLGESAIVVSAKNVRFDC